MLLQSVFALGLASVVRAAPCDIYSAGGTPCIAAHSSTRALFDKYNGALYQIKRASDGTTRDIGPLSAGGVAKSSDQDDFCSGTTCLITFIYDQTGRGNHLGQAKGGYWSGPDVNGWDNMAAADGAPVTLNGKKAYGVFVSPGTGYRNNDVSGSATGDEPEGIYAVFDGTHYNGGCCFDYGNAETSSSDTGAAHMEAIYFGDVNGWGTGAGNGPWVMADLENGLFSGKNAGNNPGDPTVNHRFLTAIVKGEPGTWAIRGGDATSGGLSTFYDGDRPDGYNPMHKEGALLLGIGGDNSNTGQGTFYEGCVTSGYPSDDTENSVQADIVAAGYAVTSLTSGPSLDIGSSVSLHVTTPGYTNRYLAHSGSDVITQVVSSSSSASDRGASTWTVRTGLANSDCVSFESNDAAGSFIRHSGFVLYVNSNDGSKQFSEDATFCPIKGLNGQGNSMRSWSYPTRYFRHYGNKGYAASDGGVHDFDNSNSFTNDVSFIVEDGLA
ncbi:alpha-n-arabinofuranosidase B [Fusarium circinatum]|uniref:Alpha-L-arabinofuranosidase n=1 Tax=Fusarium circinatum TaxID=48490 RepID=A0A8H5TSB0_FUSCI|nr:alpha-n-arabinofuranosidase B [Fusarium circinatum]